MKNLTFSIAHCCFVSMAAVSFSGYSLAQTNNDAASTPASIDHLDTISVTATREAEASLDVPASVSVVDQKSVAVDQPNYQKDLFNSVAGVRISQTGSTLGHMTAIRMPMNTGPYYLFLQDGIPVQSSGFFNHNGLAYTNFSSAGSAEVLKGAGTALYGSDSIAATINVISNDPSEFDGYRVKADTGSNGFYKLGVTTGGTLEGGSNLGINLSHTINEGWRDHTSAQRTELTGTHFTTLNDSNALKTVFILNTTESDMSGNLIGLDELNHHPDSVGDIASALASGLEIQRKFDFARLSTEWTHYLNDTVELSTIGYVRGNRNRYIATWERNLPENDSTEKTAGLMLKADMTQDALHTIVGMDMEYTESNRTYTQLFDYVPSGFGSSVPKGKIYDYDVAYFAVSPYASAGYDLTEKLQLNAGLRYDHNQYNYTNNLADGAYASSTYLRPASDSDPSFEHFSPKLGLSYHFDSSQHVYARYANSFRIPQATRLYSLKTNNVNFTLDPEISDTYEIGYKLATLRHRFDASVYFMSIDDTIVSRENASGDQYYVNGGETRHQGIEVAWLYKPVDQLSVRLAYSYSEHKFVNDPVYGNNEQAAAPNDVANLRLSYEPSAVKGLTTVAELEYVGEYWLDDKNTHTYDGYTVTHLKALYQISEQLKVSAKINNVTDEIYAENATFSYGKEKYTPAAPRQFFAGLEYSF